MTAARDFNRLALLLLAIMALALVFAFDLDAYLGIERIRALRADLAGDWRRDPWLTGSLFLTLNIAALALSVPGAVLAFTVAAGAIFGSVNGAIIALTAIIAGDSLAFLLARHVFRDWIEDRFSLPAQRVNAGLKRDGAFYLLSLRLLAVMPYFLVNWTMGITRIRLRVFAPVSFIGLIPATILYVDAGSELSRLRELDDIYSPRLLATFALLALLPLIARVALRRWRALDSGRGVI